MCKNILNSIALALGAATIVLAYTGGYDTKPLLGIAVFCLALASMNCCQPVMKKKKR